MRIVLTGGTGFIGSALLEQLVTGGHEVTALVRNDAAAAKVKAAGAQAVVGDLYDADRVAAQFEGADAVVHTAAASDGTSERMDRAVTTAAIRALGGTGRPYVHTGGIWIWGDNADITEESPLRPPAITGWRLAVEQTVLDAADLTATIVTPGIVHGYGQGIPAAVFPSRAEPVRLVGSGTQHWTTVHVDDVAALYRLVVERGERLGRVIAASGHNPTVGELGAAFAGAAAAPETEDDSRARLGGPFADALLLDQQSTAAKAWALGWTPTGPSLVNEFTTGTYASR